MPLNHPAGSREHSFEPVSEVSSEWGIAAIYDCSVLNALWFGDYTDSLKGLEEVPFRQTLSQGRQWEEGLVQLAGVSVSYNEADGTIALNKRIVEDRRVITRQELGARGKVLTQLSRQTSALHKELRVEVGLAASYWRYSTADGGSLRLQWTSPPTFSMSDDDYLRSELEKHYTSVRNMVMTELPSPASTALHDIWVSHEKNQHLINFLVVDRPVTSAACSMRSPSAPASGTGDAERHVILFSADMFPSVRLKLPPEDRDWVPRLFAPQATHHFDEGFYLAETEAYWAFYAPLMASRDASPTGAITSRPELNPLAKIVSAGDSVHELKVSGTSSGVAWTLAGEALGKLEVQLEQPVYRPPQALNPQARLSAESKTLQPAAYKVNAFAPVSTDIVRATVGQLSAEAIFVSQYLIQTHHFKVAKQGCTNVSFSLCYVNKNGEEEVVPAANVKWHILAGNGTLSEAGVFIPDPVSPTACTVVMAEEYNELVWYWALTVIPSPLFDADAIVGFFEAEA
ncbi:hypothetical protein PS627_01247 [Pseudomonas fluorescens]|uniref:hypothetical protein n=1 Tax=Pseudomonas fluorescens TaxID=294 RepID=UPI00125C4A5C|nr:hypothetical protein [Pseudomonas fluorescens]CAG8865343.1 hypothetical protein PS627_01247 [Pseudomonas fluorescens]